MSREAHLRIFGADVHARGKSASAPSAAASTRNGRATEQVWRIASTTTAACRSSTPCDPQEIGAWPYSRTHDRDRLRREGIVG